MLAHARTPERVLCAWFEKLMIAPYHNLKLCTLKMYDCVLFYTSPDPLRPAQLWKAHLHPVHAVFTLLASGPAKLCLSFISMPAVEVNTE